MIARLFHRNENAKRRGDFPPGCSRFTSRRGVTLVELMIAMLILTIVCLSWLKIIGIQSAKREARRREAVERLSGMMDAFMYIRKLSVTPGSYEMDDSQEGQVKFAKAADSEVHRMFEGDLSPVGYKLDVVSQSSLPGSDRFTGWNGKKWLVGRLYDRSGDIDSIGKPFFTVMVCLGL